MKQTIKNRKKTWASQFEIAEFKIGHINIIYQFKLRGNSVEPLFVVVDEDSRILETLRPGDVIPMKYYGPDRSQPAKALNTKIKHISRNCPGKFRGHVMIGLDTGCTPREITGG